MLIKISDVRDAIEEVWITLLWTKINKIWYLFRRFCESENMSSFVVSSLEKMKNEEVKKKWCYGFTSPAYWKLGKFVCFKLEYFRTETHVFKYVINGT